jgi:PAS domain S-box-containing protein
MVNEDSVPEGGGVTARPRAWAGLTVFALLICVGLVAGLAWMILREIDELSTANSDNLQWTLSQTDVEFLRMRLALERTQLGLDDLGSVRRRFDIFYSRIATLETGEVFRVLRARPDFETPRIEVKSFLDGAAPLIDGPDAALSAALPDLIQRSGALAEDVRAISLSGLVAFAEESDHRREELIQAMILMAVVLGALLFGLVLVAGTLFALGRLAARRTREAQRTAARLRTIVETSLDAIIVADAEGRILEFNPAARGIFGYERASARGRNAIDLLFPADSAEVLRGGKLRFLEENRRPEPGERQLELTAIDSAGQIFPVELSVDRAEQDGDHVFVASIRDISRRKAAEEGLTLARDRALAGERAKAEFLAVMSHEMRTPLNGLLGSMELLSDHSLSERQSSLLDRMRSSGRILLALVNDVLDLAKFEAGKMEAESRPFSVTRLVDGVIETAAPLAEANGNTLAWQRVGQWTEGAIGDPRRLRQVLLNLVGNAVKFTRGGTIDLEVEALGPDRDQLEFRVIDTGIGIAEEHLERIFHDFETLDSSYARQAGGTGLGLGISRRLVALMGGEIGAESEPGEGSLFWLRVPVSPLAEAPPGTHRGSDRRAVPARPLDLLLVEDNEINRFVAREILEAEGHRVTEATDGRAGVEWAEARFFDAILMDISMPVMDGTEAARKIRAGQGPSARSPIIAVTAHALPTEIARFREAGMEYCVSKPIDRRNFVETLAQIAAGAPAPIVLGEIPNAAEPALLDEDQLGSLGERLDPAAMAGLIERFIAETDAAIGALAGADLETDNLQSIAHKSAESCATFGVTALRAALAEIETAAKTGAPIPSADLTRLPDLWARSRTALLAWRDGA